MIGFLTDPVAFAAEWYRWGVSIGFAIVAVVAVWVFFDSQRQRLHTPVLRTLALAAAILVVPGVVLSLFPYLETGLGDLPLLLAYLGLLASALGLSILVLYSLGIGVAAWAEKEDLVDDPLPAAQPITPIEVQVAPPQTTRPEPRSPVHPQSPTVAQSISPAEDPTHIMPPPPPALEPLAWLVVMNGPWAGKEFRLHSLAHVGRDAVRNEISLDDIAISRQHARVRLEKDEFVIYDLASANGTLVNGERVERRPLHPRDRVIVGQTEFAFMRVDEGSEQIVDSG